MKTKMSKNRFSFTAVAVLLCALLVMLAGCKKDVTPDEYAEIWKNATYTENTQVGEGKSSFDLEVVVGDNRVVISVFTDKDTVGEALLENEIIDGEEGPYGLYVKVVNGITADYDTDGTYWSFEKNGEIVNNGVDLEEFENGAHYEFIYTKG